MVEAALTPERIEQPDARADDIGDVPGDQRQPDDLRRRSQQAVYNGQGVRHVQPSPLLCNRPINRQDPVAMCLAQAGKPAVERSGGVGVAAAHALDGATDLTDRQDAQVNLLVGEIAEPGRDVGIGTLALTQLGDDVGIEQVAQSWTARPRSSGRSKSRSSPTSGIASKSSLSDCTGSPGLNASRRICRCSSSAEWP